MTTRSLPGSSLRLALTLGLLATLSACGGGGEDPGAPSAAALAVLVAVEVEAPGARCSAGGNAIGAGLDGNGDGVLAASEWTSTQYVCNGAPGLNGSLGVTGATGAAGGDGLSTLVSMVAEPAGANCASGGEKLSAGKDANANGVLDASEVGPVAYICHGDAGLNGSGTNGFDSLIVLAAETAGGNCSYGGQKVTSGLDANRNAGLDVGEITSTSYTCNGAPGAAGADGAAGPAGPGMVWISTALSTVAEANTGYLALAAATPVTLTLPPSASLTVGDVIRLSGLGSGGWVVAQQTGQTIATAGIASAGIGTIWTPRDSSRDWQALASSANGDKLVGVVYGGQIYTSTDAGATWTARNSTRYWNSVTSSADGNKLVAVVRGGFIYTSTDAGITWTPRDSFRNWQAVASSADGTKLLASNYYGGDLYTSSDSGVTWTPRGMSGRDWVSAASSADGTKLVAGTWGGQIYTSGDSGVTWTARDSGRQWISVASSADGSKLVASVFQGLLYTSGDFGVTWRASGDTQYWQSVASSADGNRLTAVASGNYVYVSANAGLTWTARDSIRNWVAIASTADGTKLVAGLVGGRLYTSSAWTSLGTGGAITGAQHEAIELQYAGGGVFTVLSYVGSLVAR